MAHIWLIIFVSSIIVPFFFLYTRKQNGFSKSWRFFRVMQSLLLNTHTIHDKLVEVLDVRHGTMLIKSKFLINTNMLFTCDPDNVRHITTTMFLTYPKGIEWRKRFDIFGDGLFNSDFDEWRNQKTILRSFLKHQHFNQVIEKLLQDKINKGLKQYLTRVSEESKVIDLKDVFQRLVFDIACVIATGLESNSLGLGLPNPPFIDALDDACEAIFSRYCVVDMIWKLQSMFGIGNEKKMTRAGKVFDRLIEEYISKLKSKSKKDLGYSLLELYMSGHEVVGCKTPSYNLMRDNIVGLIFALQDTTSAALSWFFWLLSKHPNVENKITNELSKVLTLREYSMYKIEELNKLVYLHATLCETLRLFPPVPFEGRTPTQDDVLPSGHRVDRKTLVIISSYAMGRMSWVWGKDCDEFKPERWITSDGKIKYVPPHKFFSFNAGPRICPGKDLAFTLMKTIVATIFKNFDVEVVENNDVTYKPSIILQMKHGLRVKINSKST